MTDHTRWGVKPFVYGAYAPSGGHWAAYRALKARLPYREFSYYLGTSHPDHCCAFKAS